MTTGLQDFFGSQLVNDLEIMMSIMFCGTKVTLSKLNIRLWTRRTELVQ